MRKKLSVEFHIKNETAQSTDGDFIASLDQRRLVGSCILLSDLSAIVQR